MLPYFSSKCNGHYTKQLHFSFIRPWNMSPQIKIFAFANCNLAIYVAFRVQASSSLNDLSAHVCSGLVLV